MNTLAEKKLLLIHQLMQLEQEASLQKLEQMVRKLQQQEKNEKALDHFFAEKESAFGECTTRLSFL